MPNAGYIQVPNNSWFSNILLYWDRVYSIVPLEYYSYPTLLEDHTRTLIKENLLKPLHPAYYIEKIPDFETRFLAIADKQNSHHNDTTTTRVHIEKLGSLSNELIERGYAKRLEYPWFSVKRNIANQFMLYLATELGKLNQIHAKPVTDELIHNEVCQIREKRQHKLELTISQIRPPILKQLLPSPIEEIEPRAILSFKEDHGDLLVKFRGAIEDKLIDLAALPEDTRDDAISLFIEEKKTQMNELRQLMDDRGWRTKLWDVAGYSIASLGAAYTVLKGEPSIIGPTFGFSSLIFKYLGQKNRMVPNDMAYAVLAEKRFIG